MERKSPSNARILNIDILALSSSSKVKIGSGQASLERPGEEILGVFVYVKKT
jgi:hypothetical protein